MIRKYYNLFISSDRKLSKQIKTILGFTPSRLDLFKMAFYHKSMNNNLAPKKAYNNERLEFLGDAVLSTVVAEYLFKKYPFQNEGFLTKMRSKIVKRKTLNSIADKMGIDVILSEFSQGSMSRSMMGNAFEALIGAIYIERGYAFTRNFIEARVIRKYLDIHQLELRDENYKSQLLEYCQKNGFSVDYRLLSKYKYDKRDRFKIAVVVDGKEIATAEDFNKKSAEQTASEMAISNLSTEQNT